MSFKTFECITDDLALSTVPAEGWELQGDTILIQATGNNIQGYFDCDPNLSGFWGANNVQSGMTEEDFQELWPWIALLLLTAFCVKKLRQLFEIGT